jgi:hypothetical protein
MTTGAKDRDGPPSRSFALPRAQLPAVPFAGTHCADDREHRFVRPPPGDCLLCYYRSVCI